MEIRKCGSTGILKHERRAEAAVCRRWTLLRAPVPEQPPKTRIFLVPNLSLQTMTCLFIAGSVLRR